MYQLLPDLSFTPFFPNSETSNHRANFKPYFIIFFILDESSLSCFKNGHSTEILPQLPLPLPLLNVTNWLRQADDHCQASILTLFDIFPSSTLYVDYYSFIKIIHAFISLFNTALD